MASGGGGFLEEILGEQNALDAVRGDEAADKLAAFLENRKPCRQRDGIGLHRREAKS